MNSGYLPNDDELTAAYEARAKRKHDKIIEMGGRPRRPVLLQPSWTAIYNRNGLNYLPGREGQLGDALSDDENPMNHHWEMEKEYFEHYIRIWRDFRQHQEDMRRSRLFSRLETDLEFDHTNADSRGFGRLETDLELDHTNAELVKVLKRLSDWEEFEMFWRRKDVDALKYEECFRSYFSGVMNSESLGEESSPSSEVHENIRIAVFESSIKQKELGLIKGEMDWIKSEWPKLVAESIDTISPDLLPVLEARFKKQTYATFNAIRNLAGQPGHAIRPPDESMDYYHRILHWSAETAIYKKDFVEWEAFLEWREHKVADKSTVERQQDQCAPFRSALEVSREFEDFGRHQYDLALSWVKCSQRVVRWYEEEMEMPKQYYRYSSPQEAEGVVEKARSWLTRSEEKLADAARRLEKSAQDHALALSEHVSFSHGKTWMEGQRGAFLPTPPISNSGSSRTSRSVASSCSNYSRSSRSPHSSRSSLSSKSSHSSQSSQSAEPPSKDRNLRKQISPSAKAERRPKKINTRRLRAKNAKFDANTEQQAAPKISPGPQQVIIDDDIKMTDASEDPGAVEGAGNEDTDMTDPCPVGGTDFKDTDMTGPNDTLGNNTLFSSESLSRPSKKSPTSSGNGVASRKTKSVSKPDHTFSGRTPKNVGKKPTKKAKKFTEQQASILLDAASGISFALESSPPLRRSDRLKECLASNGNDVGNSPTKKATRFTEHQKITLSDAAPSNPVLLEPPQLRRSDRLKRKASASAITPPSHPYAYPSLQPPERMQLKRKSVTIESSRPSKKTKIQQDALEPLQDSTQQYPRKQANTIEQSRSRRQKKPVKGARSAVGPG